jgi:hypothetical protein
MKSLLMVPMKRCYLFGALLALCLLFVCINILRKESIEDIDSVASLIGEQTRPSGDGIMPESKNLLTSLNPDQQFMSPRNDRRSAATMPKNEIIHFSNLNSPELPKQLADSNSPIEAAATETRPRTHNEVLLSLGSDVGSSVRGNLGPATAVVTEKMEDWLADRWQAAMNM